MIIKIPYGKEYQELSINAPFELLEAASPEIKDEKLLINDALKNPVTSPTAEDFIANARDLLIIVNDASRPTPTAKIIKELYGYLNKCHSLTFIIATGTHRAPTHEEMIYIFGEFYAEFKHNIIVHDSRNKAGNVYMGTSKHGTEIYLNRCLQNATDVLVIGSVEPHYFAGYTGGRKAFLPGIAGYRSVEMNHQHAMSDDSQSLALKGNPVAEDMTDALDFLNYLNIFSIQAVLTGEHKIYAVTAGEIVKSFELAVRRADEIYCVRYKSKADIVIAVAPYPLDIDLYQAQKALENGKLALKDNGVLILVSKCRMGVGEAAFMQLLGRANSCQEALDAIAKGYRLGDHKAAKLLQLGARVQLYLVSDIDDKIAAEAKFIPQSDVQTAFDNAVKHIERQGKSPKTIILPQASLTVPLKKQC
ncbi:MAG: nickel-dependent lactate racemase [Victivallaceae bacterium]|nr:nickel-dependent lactate racemase [Victivallaceae bacterium]